MIEDLLSHVSAKSLALACVAVYAIWRFAIYINDERKIRTLGGHARKVKTKVPWGMKCLYPKLHPALSHTSQTWISSSKPSSQP